MMKIESLQFFLDDGWFMALFVTKLSTINSICKMFNVMLLYLIF